MAGKSFRNSEYLTSLSPSDRLTIAERKVAGINSELVAAIADGNPERVAVLTDRLKRTATEFSNDILLEIDAEELVAYKAVLEPLFKHTKEAFQELKSQGKSETEAIRSIQHEITDLVKDEEVSSFLEKFSHMPFLKNNRLLSVQNIVTRRDSSQLALDVLADFAGREPETLRKVMRPFMSQQESLGRQAIGAVVILFLVHVIMRKGFKAHYDYPQLDTMQSNLLDELNSIQPS
jgi:hypothetical protein